MLRVGWSALRRQSAMTFDITDPIFTDENAAREHLEAQRWPHGPSCPHCGEAEQITKLEGKKHRPGVYQCNACRQQFTVTVGTVFERSKIPLHKWLLATYLLSASKKGMSAHQLHRMLDVTYKTSWFMAHRIREAMREQTGAAPLGGAGKIVKVDETYIGRVRGMRKTRGPSHKMKVLSLVERGGNVRSIKVESVSRPPVEAIVAKNVARESRLMTDEAPYYPAIGTWFVSHESVNHRADEWARRGPHQHARGLLQHFQARDAWRLPSLRRETPPSLPRRVRLPIQSPLLPRRE
jgi:transposase-like protein